MKKALGVIFFISKEIFWGTVNALVMIVAGAAIASFFIYKYQMPDVYVMAELRNPETSIIYDRTGKTALYKIHGEENRKILNHREIPEVVRIATIAAEDKAFYSHMGIDFFSVARALKNNVEEKGIIQGGSTITQQLARNVFLSREKTFARKFKEALIAIKIENSFSKDEIMDLYLNEVPYGSNAYGIESASETFFNKSARDLTLDESVFLSALPKAPSHYSPYGGHQDELKNRIARIYRKLDDLKIIPAEEIKKSQETDTFSKIAPLRQPIVAPHFVFYVMSELEKKYGRDFLKVGGLKVITTLDLDLQKIGERIVVEGAENNKTRNAENAALVAIDPRTGEILAMVGSRDYFDKNIDGEVNVAVRPRQPGSSIKPIIYATAFEKGFGPQSQVSDSPANFGPDGSGGDYIPRNYDGKFHGTLPMRKTLAMSLNIPAVKTLQAVGVDAAIDMAHRLGITTFKERKKYGLSLAIGGAEVRPLDLTAAFSVFANDGKKNSPASIIKIEDASGNKYSKENREEQVVNPQIARKINSILSDNEARTPIFGSSSPLFIPGKTVAVKTGTTQEFRDAWTVGYFPDIAVGVWCGNNDGSPMAGGSDGVFVAAPIWRKFMDSISENYGREKFIVYDEEVREKQMVLRDNQSDKNDNSRKKRKKGEKKKG